MKSNVNLFLEAGAVLLGSTDPDDYKTMDTEGRPSSPKNDDNSQLALVLESKTENTQRTDGCTIQPTVYGPI